MGRARATTGDTDNTSPETPGFGLTTGLIGLFVGIGTAGLVAGSIAAQFVTATITAAIVSGGLYLGLTALGTRYLHKSRTASRRDDATTGSVPSIAADGSGDRE